MMNLVKKWAAMLLSAALLVTVPVGCSGGSVSSSSESSSKSSESSASSETLSSSKASSETASQEDSSSSNADVQVRVGTLKGPTAMGMVKLMQEGEAGTTANRYEFTISAAIDEVSPKLIQGELDIAAVPANMASVLYNNTKGEIQVLAVNTLGVLYLVETGESIQSAQDLKGRTIYASGKGATPEYALNYLLSGNGIDPEQDVQIEYKSEHAECVAALLQAEDAIAMLPQPFVTTAQIKDERIRIALDMTEEWEKLQDGAEEKSALLTGVMVVRKKFAQEHPEAVEDFLKEYQTSTEFVNANLQEAAALIETYDIVPAAVAEKALPYCNITCISGQEMKTQLGGYLQVLFQQNPKAVGGALPGEDFYYGI